MASSKERKEMIAKDKAKWDSINANNPKRFTSRADTYKAQIEKQRIEKYIPENPNYNKPSSNNIVTKSNYTIANAPSNAVSIKPNIKPIGKTIIPKITTFKNINPVIINKTKIKPIINNKSNAYNILKKEYDIGKNVRKKIINTFYDPKNDKRITQQIAEKVFPSSENIDTDFKSIFEAVTGKKSKITQVYRNFMKGASNEYRKNPEKAIALFALSFAVPKVLGLTGKAIKPITNIIGKIPGVKTIGNLANKGLTYLVPSAYGGYTVYRVANAEEGKKIEEIGKIYAGEILPSIAGSVLGSKFWKSFDGWIRTNGRTEIEMSKIVPEDVATGKKRFPNYKNQNPKKLQELFLKQSQRLPGQTKPSMYHSTGDQFWDDTITANKGKSEFEGLYGSYGVSPNFLRIENTKSNLYGGKFFQPYVKPGVANIVPKKFSIQKPLSMPIMKGRIPIKQGIVGLEKGVAYVPGYKTEVEAILPPGTELKKIASKYYFKWNGVKVPIDQFITKTSSKKVIVSTNKFMKTLSSYYGKGSYPLTTPGTFIAPFYKSSNYSGDKKKTIELINKYNSEIKKYFSKPNYPNKSSKPSKSNKSSYPEKPNYPKKLNKSNKSNYPEKPNYPKKPSKPSKPSIPKPAPIKENTEKSYTTPYKPNLKIIPKRYLTTGLTYKKIKSKFKSYKIISKKGLENRVSKTRFNTYNSAVDYGTDFAIDNDYDAFKVIKSKGKGIRFKGRNNTHKFNKNKNWYNKNKKKTYSSNIMEIRGKLNA